ncbi:MAG TPA: hypothetical protein VEU33_49375 [Archangium sp.]|nr:hypothetical protein [Archangium sp.]
MKSRLLPLRRRGQATVEYVVVTAALLGFGTLGWPFLVQMLNALGKYFQSIYDIIQSSVP